MGEYVDVMHTDGQALILPLGLMEPRGHADFYPNKGRNQPGCFTREAYKNNITDSNAAYEDFGCMHYRAVEYFEDSFSTADCHVAAYECTDENKLPGSCTKCDDGRCAVMGVDNIIKRPHGIFYLETNSKAPFCKYGN